METELAQLETSDSRQVDPNTMRDALLVGGALSVGIIYGYLHDNWDQWGQTFVQYALLIVMTLGLIGLVVGAVFIPFTKNDRGIRVFAYSGLAAIAAMLLFTAVI